MKFGLVAGIIAGSIAGIIGALIWGGITYATGYEVGYLAWGIGGLVGLGVMIGSDESAGMVSGLIAIALANVSIFAGKMFAVWMLLSSMLAGIDSAVPEDFQATESYLISDIADVIVEEREEAGITFEWPEVDYEAVEDVPLAEYDHSIHYPADIWKEAETQWAALTPQEQADRKEEAESDSGESAGGFPMGFLMSFTIETLEPMDILWVLLASVTAFRIGANDGD